MSKDLDIRVSHRLRVTFYVLGIVILLAQLTFNVIGRAREKAFVDPVRYHAQYQTQEYRNCWLGIEMQQFATDLMSHADLIYRLKPEVVIETGTYKGGLTVYLATLMERVSPAGRVIAVDIADGNWNQNR
jgi:cephalosporin hydroxylase